MILPNILFLIFFSGITSGFKFTQSKAAVQYNYKTKAIVLFSIISLILQVLFGVYSTIISYIYQFISSQLDRFLKIKANTPKPLAVKFPFKKYKMPVIKGFIGFIFFIFLTLLFRKYI